MLAPTARREPRSSLNLVTLDGGTFLMGTDDGIGFPADGEGPVREVTIRPFQIAAHTTSNARFAEFAEATGHVTEAERYGWSFVFAGFLPGEFEPTRGAAGAPWWRQVFGATWRNPDGPQSSLEERMDHPVVHVAWNDAQAFCAWSGTRLPSEAEWEYAARGGLDQARYAWGDEFRPDGQTMCNIFEGTFPTTNTVADGYAGTAPVDAFSPNRFGLYNVAGNVWEWCRDWHSPSFHVDGPRENPVGPATGEARVTRGGSYLCHDSYCNRYRVAARSSNTPESSAGNLGFRVAADVS